MSPDRSYQPSGPIYRWHDRIAAHWMEAVIAVVGILRGALILIDDLRGARGPAVLELPLGHSSAILGFLVAGSVVWLVTIVRRFQAITTLWMWQRLATGFAALGWTGYTLAAGLLRPDLSGWVIWLAITIGCWGSFGLSFRAERRHRKRLES